jgi:hypothetical protein
MKLIKSFITRGVTRFLEGGGAQETMHEALIMKKRRYQDYWKEEKFSTYHASFPSVSG